MPGGQLCLNISLSQGSNVKFLQMFALLSVKNVNEETTKTSRRYLYHLNLFEEGTLITKNASDFVEKEVFANDVIEV